MGNEELLLYGLMDLFNAIRLRELGCSMLLYRSMELHELFLLHLLAEQPENPKTRKPAAVRSATLDQLAPTAMKRF